MKHINIHFVREKITSGELELRYVPTTHMTVDILTKALSCVSREISEVADYKFKEKETNFKEGA